MRGIGLVVFQKSLPKKERSNYLRPAIRLKNRILPVNAVRVRRKIRPKQPLSITKTKPPKVETFGGLKNMPGSVLLSHGETPHYHRRYAFSLKAYGPQAPWSWPTVVFTKKVEQPLIWNGKISIEGFNNALGDILFIAPDVFRGEIRDTMRIIDA